MTVITIFGSLLLIIIEIESQPQHSDCSQSAYDRCVRIADPLVKEGHLVIPDNMNDIDIVCRTWNRFVDCLNEYTDNCFTDDQRRKFNKAVENPIGSIHQMCRDTNYQQEYLIHAPCIKNLVTQREHCAQHYNQLVDQVSQGDIISKSTLCCSHDRFKQCVLRETEMICDRGVPNGPASRFSHQIVEKSLSFYQDQCYNYIPNSGDCGHSPTDSRMITDPLTISTSSSEVYPWSTIQDINAKEILPSRVTPPKMTTTSWLPSSTLPIQTSPETSQVLGSRSRPASYGRSSWSSTEKYPDLTTSRPTWTTSNWLPKQTNEHEVTSQIDDSIKTSTTWYPAAGDQLGNEVEEPNQQGWTNKRNSATQSHYIPLIIISLSIFVMLS